MDLKETARLIFMEAVRAADPSGCVRNMLEVTGKAVRIGTSLYSPDEYPRIVVIGGGKASARMGENVEEILGDRITGGWINTKDGYGAPLKHIHVHECSHPVPDERGVEGTRRIVDILSGADEKTLVLCLLSGGGSALMPAPAEDVTLAEKQEVTRLLLMAGADIGELNTVRKHLSVLKGGGMARLAFPARLHVLILSDVIGDRLDTIASGPAVSDRSTFGDCLDICTRYSIMEKLPAGVRIRFEKGAHGDIPETAKPGDFFLLNAENTLIGNNRMSVQAARKTAEALGFHTLLLSTFIQGEASDTGTFYASIASEIQVSGNPVEPPACIIGGGETTVTVRGNGTGGRNQEMALSTAAGLAGMKNVAFLSGGTDGTDGPTDAAGGVVDGDTVRAGRTKGFSVSSFLMNNDSYRYLKETGALLITGPTGTNVMDIQVLLVGKPG